MMGSAYPAYFAEITGYARKEALDRLSFSPITDALFGAVSQLFKYSFHAAMKIQKSYSIQD